MFNFTTQTVYNNINIGIPLQGGGFLTPDNDPITNPNVILSNNEKKPAIRIGNTRFDADNIENIYMKTPVKENLAEVTFDMADIVSNEEDVVARIALYIGLSMNDQSALYGNELTYKGKPFFIEFGAKKNETAATVAKRVKKIVEKYLVLNMGEKLLTVEVNSGNVKIKATNGYQIFKKAELQVYNPEAKQIDCCSVQGDYATIKVGVPVVYTIGSNGKVTLSTSNNNKNVKVSEDGDQVELGDNEVAITPGTEAFGDYNWIIHNLRLPTAMNTNFWAPTRHEMPISGQSYTQFTIYLKKERDGIMGEIVGARGTSVTTHVLYVLGDANVLTTPAGILKALLETSLNVTINNTADTNVNQPYNASPVSI